MVALRNNTLHRWRSQWRWLCCWLAASLLVLQQSGCGLAQEVSTTVNDVDLPFGDINVLVLTDVHSWVGGHRQNEPLHNADYGDVLSFYHRLKEHCRQRNMDLWFVVNG